MHLVLHQNPGEVAEWLKAPVSKTGISGNRDRGFESRPLRHSSFQACPTTDSLRDDRRPDAAAERCRSGLTGTPGKRVWAQTHRRFESCPLRHRHIATGTNSPCQVPQCHRYSIHVNNVKEKCGRRNLVAKLAPKEPRNRRLPKQAISDRVILCVINDLPVLQAFVSI